MSVRRAVLLALVLYLGADYSDPSIPGVFSFGTAAFFVESVDARSSTRAVLPPNGSPLRPRDVVVASRPPVVRPVVPGSIPVHARAEHRPYAPRAHVVISPPAASAVAEDH
jgi:hypothetical protein